MRHCTKEPRFVSRLAVYVPSVEALLDMMRYDSCYPATEDDARKLAHLVTGEAWSSPADHLIRLTRVARNNQPATAQRWRSFGCHVLDERPPEHTQPTDDELLELVPPARAR